MKLVCRTLYVETKWENAYLMIQLFSSASRMAAEFLE
jgi:hypothetical protein